MTRRPTCAHTITSHGSSVSCRLSLGHSDDHAHWTPDGSRIEWDSTGLVLARVGQVYKYRPFRPGQRVAVEVDLRTWGTS